METAAEPLLPSVHLSQPPYDSINTASAEISTDTVNMSSRSSWLFYATASGACASFNGVFAKLYSSGLITAEPQRIDNRTDFEIQEPQPSSLALSPATSPRFFTLGLGASWWNTSFVLFVYRFSICLRQPKIFVWYKL